MSLYFRSPPNSQQVLCELTCPSAAFLFWCCGDTPTHPLGTFMERRQTSVWKALLTVMHARFIRRLGNGGGGRVPNTARAFIFDITKRSLAWGQAGVYGNIKCRHVLSVGGAPGERRAMQRDSTSLHGCALAKKSIRVSVVQSRVTCGCEVG